MRRTRAPSVLPLIQLALAFLAGARSYRLELVSVVFRHGDRSPVHPYPNDRYQASYWPQGLGQLSIVGMQQQYALGQWLRKEYVDNGFVNGNYSRTQVTIRSTDVDRTLMSAESQLASLFAPGPSQQFNQSLYWQPIPVHTVPKNEDNLLRGYDVECPAYTQAKEDSYNTEEYLTVECENEALFKQLSGYAGAEVNLSNVFTFYDTLFVEHTNNLTMPSWFNESLLAQLKNLSEFTMAYMYNSELKKKVAGGVWANTVISNMVNKAAGLANMTDLNLLLYSAHDTTVAAMLNVFDMWDGIQPEYATAFIVELVTDDDGQNYYVNFRYHNKTDGSSAVVLKLSDCSVPCPLDQVVSIMNSSAVTSEEWNVLCGNTSSSSSCSNVAVIVLSVLLGIALLLLVVAVIFIAYRWTRSGNKGKKSYKHRLLEDDCVDSDGSC